MAKKKNLALLSRRPKWGELDKITLWSRCAGRCEMCNKILYKSDLSQNQVNIGQFAHVIGHSDLAARADINVDRSFRDSIENIMLLCHQCHKDIDDNADIYDTDTLFKIKADFEDKIEAQTEPTCDTRRKILIFTAPIYGRKVTISREECIEALRPSQFPMGSPLEINLDPTRFNESNQEFWTHYAKEIDFQFETRIEKWLNRIPKIAVFGLAPQPLLAYLGWKLGERCDKQIFQRHRETQKPWRWEKGTSDTEFIVRKLMTNNTSPSIIALSLSVSFDISERVSTYLDKKSLHWDISIPNPNTECVDAPTVIADFRKVLHYTLNEISNIADSKPIHVYMAVPASLAVTFGMSIMPKATSQIIIHDYIKQQGLDVEAIKINF